MSDQIDALSKVFALKEEVPSREDVTAKINEAFGREHIIATPATNPEIDPVTGGPAVHYAGETYIPSSDHMGVPYPYFLDATNTPLTPTALVAGQLTSDNKFIWEGHWRWQKILSDQVVLPDYTPIGDTTLATKPGTVKYGQDPLADGTSNATVNRSRCHGSAITFNGPADKIHIWIGVAGSLTFQFFTKGEDGKFTDIPGMEYTRSMVVGLNTITVANFGIRNLKVGYYVGFYSPASGGAQVRAVSDGPANSSYNFPSGSKSTGTNLTGTATTAKLMFQVEQVVSTLPKKLIDDVSQIKTGDTERDTKIADHTTTLSGFSSVSINEILVHGTRMSEGDPMSVNEFRSSGVAYDRAQTIREVGFYVANAGPVNVVWGTWNYDTYQFVPYKIITFTAVQYYNLFRAEAGDFVAFNVAQGDIVGIVAPSGTAYPNYLSTSPVFGLRTSAAIADGVSMSLAISPAAPVLYTVGYGVNSKKIAQTVRNGLRDLAFANKSNFWAAQKFIAERTEIKIVGQSLTMGSHSRPALTTTPVPGGWRFNRGVRSLDGTNRTSFVPLIETENVGQDYGETYASGIVDAIRMLLWAEDGIDLSTHEIQFLMTAPGEGGKKAAEIGTGTITYTRATQDIDSAITVSNALGKTYGLGAIVFDEGQTDHSHFTPASIYYDDMINKIYKPIVDYAQNATKSKHDVPVIMIQTSNAPFKVRTPVDKPYMSLMQNKIARDMPAAVVIANMQIPRYDDQLHLSNVGSKLGGFYVGVHAKRWLIDGYSPYQFEPIRVDRQGDTLIATYPVLPGKKLVLITGAGFGVGDTNGNAMAISDVRLIGRDKVALRCVGVSAEAAPTFRHGWNPDPAQGNKVALAGLRDNSGDTLKYTIIGVEHSIHHYALISETAVTV